MKKPFKPMLKTQGFAHIPQGISETQPDQVSSLEAILKQRMAGIPVPQFHGEYFGETDEPLELSKMDNVELQEFRQSLADKISVLKTDYHESTRQLADLEKAKQTVLSTPNERSESINPLSTPRSTTGPSESQRSDTMQ